MPKLDPPRAPVRTGSIYPAALPAQMAGRSSRRLGQAGGLTQFGVTLVTPEPGARSPLHHRHEAADGVATARPAPRWTDRTADQEP